MVQIKTSSWADIKAGFAQDKLIYDALTPEERAEVDAHNARISGKSIQEILAAGEHPFKRLKQKYAHILDGAT